MPEYLPTLAEAPVASTIPGVEERKRRERIAAALLLQGTSGEPIQHWAQGLNRVAQGLVGGYQLGETRRQGEAEEARTQAILAGLPGLQGAGTPPAAMPQRQAEPAPPAAVPAAPMDPRARGIAALSEPGVMAGQPGQNRVLDISTAVPTGYTLPTDRAKVASTDRVVGDDEGVRLGYYDVPTTPGARPPNQPDAAALTSPTQPGAVPVATQSIRPQAPAATAQVHPLIQQEMTLAKALMANAPTRAAGLQLYMKALQSAQPNYGFQAIGDKLYRTDPRTGRAEIIGSVSKPPTWGVIGEDALDRKQYGWINPETQTITPGPVGKGEAAPVTVTGPRGEQVTVPTGQSAKKFIEQLTTISADVAGGKMTEVQAKDARFAANMENAERTISGTNLEQQGLSLRGRIQEGSSNIPGSGTLGNYLQTEQYQQYRAARDKFITSLLRDESGAAIGTKEFIRYERELFPQPGDSPRVLEQKRHARQVAIDGMKQGAGPGYKSPAAPPPPAPGGDAIAEAKAAIAAGAPRAKVIERLRQNGINPPADL